ncbi:hypothetical protein C2S51_017221 [Perilla frutescens var. frutescens]|nr:hypothetical protein C2S51_017221 [Perilla frutescens var. frutescens]
MIQEECCVVDIGSCTLYFRLILLKDLAAREGLLLAIEYGGTKVTLETDCKSLYNRLQLMSSDLSYLGSVVDDVKVLAIRFAFVEYSWVRRGENYVSHQLATRALCFPSPAIFTGVICTCITLPSAEEELMV